MSGKILHYLDDPDWTIDLEDEPSRLWVPLMALLLAFLLMAGLKFGPHLWSREDNQRVFYDSNGAPYTCTPYKPASEY